MDNVPSEEAPEDVYVEPVPLKKSNAPTLTQDELQAHRSQSLTQGYAMEGKDMSKTVSVDVLPVSVSNLEMEDHGKDGNDDTNRINEEVVGSFVKAVHKKYSDIGQLEHCFMGGLVLPKSSSVKVTESGNMLLPDQVSMSGQEISVAGNTDLIRRMCQKVTHLDLMQNEIKHWEEVLSIIECIPTLTFLNLSKNHIDSALPDLCGRSLPCLTHLVLNNTNTQWDVLLQLLQVCPQIEELHLSLNNFTSVDIPENQMPCPSVRKLFFIGNHVTDWREINKLGRLLPKLESLMLCETEVSCLCEPQDMAAMFPALEILSLNRSCLQSWEEMEKLDAFPGLTDVRLHNIPFFENVPTKVRRQRQIAMLPKITMLNKSPVGEDEREDAERAFIRLFMDAETKPNRYHKLLSKHGDLQPLAKVDMRPKDTVRLKIIIDKGDENNDETSTSSTTPAPTTTTTPVPTTTTTTTNDNDADHHGGDNDNHHDNNHNPVDVNHVKVQVDEHQKQEKDSSMMEFSVHITAKTLRKMLSNITGHPASHLQLFHDDKELVHGPVKMRYPDRKLLGYRVNDGDEIIAVVHSPYKKERKFSSSSN